MSAAGECPAWMAAAVETLAMVRRALGDTEPALRPRVVLHHVRVLRPRRERLRAHGHRHGDELGASGWRRGGTAVSPSPPCHPHAPPMSPMPPVPPAPPVPLHLDICTQHSRMDAPSDCWMMPARRSARPSACSLPACLSALLLWCLPAACSACLSALLLYCLPADCSACLLCLLPGGGMGEQNV